MLCNGVLNTVTISPNSTCINSSLFLRGHNISSQICYNILQLLSTALGYLLLPGQLVFSRSGYSVSSPSLSLQPFPCKYTRTLSIAVVTASLFCRKSVLYTLTAITLFCRYFLIYLSLAISYTKPPPKSFPLLYKQFSIYYNSCSPYRHSSFPQAKLLQQLMDRYPYFPIV